MTLTLFASVLLFGCQQSSGLQEAPASPTSAKPAPNAAAPSMSPAAAQPLQDASAAPQPKGPHRFVPERVFQVDKLAKVTVKVGEHTFHLWVMDNDDKRREGMMFLKDTDFKDDEGMIFVFLGEDNRRFWMANTLVDLDVAYCDKNGRILNTYTMKSLDETTDYSSKGKAMYVIELKAGILKKLHITPGMRFVIPESVVSKDRGND